MVVTPGVRMFFRTQGLSVVLVVMLGLSAIVWAAGSQESERADLQLELADLLFIDERYWEAIPAYEEAKKGATSEQRIRASSGLLRSLLFVAEFGRAHLEAVELRSLQPVDSEVRALYADGFWASGLFEEAENIYRDILATDPSSAGAHAGLGRSLATRSQLQSGLEEVLTALSIDATRPEFHHTLATIYRRLNRFEEASDALQRFVELLPNVRRDQRAEWSRAEVRFLRSFGDLKPREFVGTADEMRIIPFRLVNDKVVIQGKVNGEGPFDLVIDTGAEQMVLSKETAQAVGVRPIANTISAGVGDIGIRALDLGRVESLEIGSLEIRNLPVIIKNPSLEGLPRGREPDSLSPLAFGLSMVIDYKTKQLTVARHLPDQTVDIDMPMRYHRLAVVQGVINKEHSKSFVVDTGGEVVSIGLGLASFLDQKVPTRRIPLQVYGTSGWDDSAFLLPGIDLAFNQISYENFSVVVLNLHRPSALLGFEIGGIVGYSFLKDYRVSFDLTRSLLRLTRL